MTEEDTPHLDHVVTPGTEAPPEDTGHSSSLARENEMDMPDEDDEERLPDE
jgi:hypothetical protein